jgi:FtsZ-binding cell division protein ZapB
VQICFEKFALASAIDAFCRKQIEINEMKEKTKLQRGF